MFYVEHADTFSYEYTVVAECETREEAEHICDWYRSRDDQQMSEHRVVEWQQLRGTVYRGFLDWCERSRAAAGYEAAGIGGDDGTR